MSLYKFRTDAGANDAFQQGNAGGSGYTNAGDLRIVASSTATSRRNVGLRFNGTIPAGTTKISEINVSGYLSQGTATGVNCTIYLQKSLTTSAFIAGGSAGPGDVNSRPTTTTGISWVQTYANGDTAETPSLIPLFKELMEDLGGAEFAHPTDPTIATTPTMVDIVNPVVLFKGNTIGGSNQEIRFIPYDSVVDNPLGYYKTPVLTVNATGSEEAQPPSDRRTHVAILSDSIGWALMPGEKIDESIMTFTILGNIEKTGLIKLEGVPAGMVAVKHDGIYYSIDDSASGIRPEGRKGFTEKGYLKDVMLETFGVTNSDIIIHSYGLGGTTIGPSGRSSGIWSNSKYHGGDTGTYESLADIPDPTADLDGILTNPLWTFTDETGHTLLQLLRDTSIERLLIIYIGGGNDVFNHAYQFGYLPMSRSQSSWDSLRDGIKTAYQDLFKFCRDVRLGAGGSDPEFIISGYPNFMTDDPRIPERNVYNGTPGGSYHRGPTPPFPAITDPDSAYGGPTGSSGYMAPIGTGSVNAIPHIPWFIFYNRYPDLVVNNVPGVDPNDHGSLPRPMVKADLGMFLQLKAFNYLWLTFNEDYHDTGPYQRWYGHWAADHYGSSFAGFDNATKWTNAKGFFEAIYDVYPYSAGVQYLITDAALNIPRWKASITNTKIAISYCTRYITNQTVNEVLQYVTKGAAEDAIDYLSGPLGGNMSCQYVELFDCLGSEVGTGDYASAGLWAFIDGVHLTDVASEIYCRKLIERARPNSEILKTLTNWSVESTSKFFQFLGND